MSGWKTALVGFGRIAAGYAEDPAQARWYPYASHAQVLRDHPAFDWQAVVDPSPAACAAAGARWGISRTAASAAALENAEEIEVAVLATPPDARRGIIECFPNLRAVIVEKPLGTNLENAEAFIAECRRCGILVAVNLPRRYDTDLRALAGGGLENRIGKPMAVFGTYGNGLRNNGTHLVDLIRMLFGSIASVGAVHGCRPFAEGPIEGDINAPFFVVMESGLVTMVQPIRFSSYREVGLDIWAERGRLQLVHESLTAIETPVADNRQLSGAMELSHDNAKAHTTSVGRALYSVYDNLSAALQGHAALLCPGEEGLATMRVVEELLLVSTKVECQ
jgi:predicted dehydrogenase